jgi:hypothetical protein
MSSRWAIFPSLVLVAGLAAACGPAEEPEAPAVEESAVAPIAGMYEVSGITVATGSGDQREISGRIILARDGDQYTATFSLSTLFPLGVEALPTEVIGKGEGRIDGRKLEGTAQTQLVIATVPGVDPGFAFVPRTVTKRLVSTSVAIIAADGTLNIEIANEPAQGEQYAPTRTTLQGRRVASGILAED